MGRTARSPVEPRDRRVVVTEFDDEGWNFLAHEAARRDVPMSEVVRDAVRNHSISQVGRRRQEDMAFAKPREVIEAVCTIQGMPVDVVLSDDCTQEVAQVRQMAMWLVHNTTVLSYPQIGKLFARDHTTVLHACRVVELRRHEDAALRDMLDTLRAELRPDPPQGEQGFSPTQVKALHRSAAE